MSTGISYLKHIDGEINDHIDKVSQGQAGYESVGAIPHTLVLVNDPKQSCIPHHSHDEDGAGYHSVNVFESWCDFSLLWAIAVHWAIAGQGQISRWMSGTQEVELCPRVRGEIFHKTG